MIIGITGKMGSGKDTVADYLTSKLHNHRKCSFADPMKRMLSIGLNLSYEQLHGNLKGIVDDRYKCTARKMMQTLGTEWGRQLIHKDIWLIAAQQSQDMARVFADVRFDNEADWIREVGYLIYIERPEIPTSDHQSEAGVVLKSKDFIINNNGSLNNLYLRIDSILKSIDVIENWK